MDEHEKDLLSRVYYDIFNEQIKDYINARTIQEKEELISEIQREIIDENYLPVGFENREFKSHLISLFFKNIRRDIKNSVDWYEIRPLSNEDPEIRKLAKRKNGVTYHSVHLFGAQNILAQENASMEAVTAGGLHDHVEDERKLHPHIDPSALIDKIVEPWRWFSKYNNKDHFYIDTLENVITRLTKPENLEYKTYISQIFQTESSQIPIPPGLKVEDVYILDIFKKDIPLENIINNVLIASQVKFADRIHNTQTVKLEKPKGATEIVFDGWGTLLAPEHYHDEFNGHSQYSLEEMIKIRRENKEKFMDKYEGYSGEVISDVMEPAFIFKKVYKNIILLSHYNRFVGEIDEILDERGKQELEVANRLKQRLIKTTKKEIDERLEFLLNYEEVDEKEAKNLLNNALDYKKKGGYKHITSESKHEIDSDYKFDGTVINKFEKILNPGRYDDSKEYIDELNKPQKAIFNGIQGENRPKDYRMKEFELLLHSKFMLEEFIEDQNFYYDQYTVEGPIKPEGPIM